jgi:LPXTG-site transpeptidase (sortase) family protein
MRKRFLVPTVVLLLLQPVSSFAQAFWDVQGSRYVTAFEYLGSRGVVGGFGDQSGRPYQELTRAEALKVLLSMQPNLKARVQQFASQMPPMPLFWDIDQTAWYAPYVETAFEAQLITGYADKSFRPGSQLSAEEAVVLLMRTYGLQAPKGATGPWYAADVTKAFALNVIAPEERLYLGGTVTRGQFFDMVFRLDTVQQNHLVAFADAGQAPAPAVPVVQPPEQVPVVDPVIIVEPEPPVPVKTFNIKIPALGIESLLVTHPDDPTTSKGLLQPLSEGVGHLFSYPGGNGKIMIYGHSSGYPWDVSKYTKVFRKVNELQQGDQVYVDFRGKQYTYQVAYKEAIPASDMQPFSGEGEELILYTCWPPDSIKQRYLVHAYPVNSMAQK